MPPKRRISGASDDSSNSHEDDATNIANTSGASEDSNSPRKSMTPEPGRKKKKVDPSQQMQNLYDFLRKYKKEGGAELCEPFIRAPKRRSEPKYYEVVSDPIDMLRIQQKLKMDEYANMDELKADIRKLLDNALKYYEPESEERKAAVELDQLYGKALEKISQGEDPLATLGSREESEDDVQEMLEELFGAVVTVADKEEPARSLHMVFRLLPSKNRYPEYYNVIKKPLDLKIIATRIQSGEYSNLVELEEDLMTVFKNAMYFNEPGSIIYRDAKCLAKLVKSKKYELEISKTARENRGARSSRRSTAKHKYSADIADLPYPDSESEDESEEGDEEREDEPTWALYNHIRRYVTPSGVKLSEPFMALPSKRELPDYYLAIREPISLNQIRKKLKGGEYGDDLDKMAEDLNLMFENCKEYNRPDTRLHKEGAKLQRIMQDKLADLQDDTEDESEEEPMEIVGSPKAAAATSPTRSPEAKAEGLRKRLRALYNAVLNYRTRQGVELIGMFMEKPSREDYPDYYEVIATPMDMATINERIKSGSYVSEMEMIADMKLMFSNCRQYNEEGSDIYDDSITLERVLIGKGKEMGVIQSTGRGRPKAGAAGAIGRPSLGKPSKSTLEKVKHLYDTLKDHKDAKGRQLSIIFLRLPSQKEFPDYFEVIKTPIDFERIMIKLKTGLYRTLDDCLQDFILMFDNACQYNEPDSQIYKDALTLQSLAHKTCRAMAAQEEEAGGGVPDVGAAVQEILSCIFISVYKHQDAEERCFSDSLQELPEHDEKAGKKVRALSLDLIKRRLDKGLYKRLDSFQRDVFAVLERARNLSRSDSQVFEDAVELQTQFIKERDEACGNGDVLQSKALLYTLKDLTASVDAVKAAKAPTEAAEDEQEQAKPDVGSGDDDEEAEGTVGQQQYRVGEFVYVEGADKSATTTIHLIEKIFAAKEGGAGASFYGNAFYRPEETFHVPTRKFLEMEVFRTDVHSTVALDKIAGRCCVVPVRDYFRMRPEGFPDKDVFVCESRYSSKARSFKKMKLFWDFPPHVKLTFRDKSLEPKRVMSVFKERIEKHKEELEEIEAMVSDLGEELPPNLLWTSNPNSKEGCVYYEQYTIPGPITLRRGDTVYVRSEHGKNLIAQIDTMWKSQADDMAYFNGPWFVTPKETSHPTSTMFYQQEVLLSTISDSNPLLSVVGKCSVLELRDYITSRPTQYSEPDVYLCEAVYDESKRLINKGMLASGMKQYEHSAAVQADEVYFFKNPITPQKEPSPHAAPAAVSALPASITSSLPLPVGGLSLDAVDNEDSMDGPPPSVGSDVATTPIIKKVKTPGKKTVTPYILFSSETRRVITDQHKNCSFGEISRIVGDKWRTLPDNEKQVFEEKAKKINEENAIKFQEEQRVAEERRKVDAAAQAAANAAHAAAQQGLGGIGPIRPALPNGTTSTPLHMVNGQAVAAAAMAAGGRPVTLTPAGQRHRSPSQGGHGMTTLAKPIEPMFHTVPPRPQRLLHSEAYIRYIEGLSSDSSTLSNWEKQVNATKENTRTDEAKLPAHWLASNGEHGTSLDALWALRDFMMQDSLGLAKMQ